MDLSLHKRQTEAFLSPATEILYGGAAGGGKSHLMRVAAIAWCVAVPGLQVYLFRRTYPDLMKNHMEGPSSFPVLLADWVKRKLVRINYTENFIQFWNGAKIFLCHCQHEKDVYKYQGAEIHVLLVDELTHFTDFQYRFLRGRVRLGGLKIPPTVRWQFPRVLCGANPGGLGHNFVKATFVDAAAAMAVHRTPKKEGGMLRQYIPAKLSDNPTLQENDPDYIDRLEGLGDPALVRAMADGDWNIVAGGMFDDLWNDCGRRTVHTIKPFDIPTSWYVDSTFDWGSSKPFSVLWWAESDGTQAPNGRHYPAGSLFLIHEWYGWNGTPNEGLKLTAKEIARGMIERETEWGLTNVHPGQADSSIFDVENDTSYAADMEAEGVLWLPADKSPGSRKQGWGQLRKYLKAALQTPMEAPGLFVFDRCTQFIRTFPALPRSDRDSDDVDTKSEDHAGDAARYRVLAPRGGYDEATIAGGTRAQIQFR